MSLEQRKDQRMSDLIKYLESETLPQNNKQCCKVIAKASFFTLIKDVPYHLDPKQKYQPRAAVPSHLREEVMKNVHNGPFSGHFAGLREKRLNTKEKRLNFSPVKRDSTL